MPSKKPRAHGVTPLVVVVLSLPGLAASAAVPASARELSGIRLGMTMEEVKAAAAAHQPPLNLDKPEKATPGELKKTDPFYVQARSYVRSQPSDFEELEITFSPPAPVPRVVQIVQITGSSEAKAPSKERLQKTLREKFGGSPARGYPGWVWKATGMPSRGEEAEDCLIDQGTWLAKYWTEPEATLAKIKDKSSACGLIAVASPRDPRRVLITITDYAALAEALEKTVELAKGSPATAQRPR
jgi:hypothetical protein